jgi:hypothetical protein
VLKAISKLNKIKDKKEKYKTKYLKQIPKQNKIKRQSQVISINN